MNPACSARVRVLRTALTIEILLLAAPAAARRPNEPEDGTPVPPCTTIGVAFPVVKLEVIGRPLRGCRVRINAGETRISVVKTLCHEPTLYNLTPSVPIRWELVSWPGGTQPSLSSTSTEASLFLGRVGTYRVRFTVCPSGGCEFRATPGGAPFDLRTASKEITIEAVERIPLPPEKYPFLGNDRRPATDPTHFPSGDLFCKCQAGGGFADPQWVAVEPWESAEDYEFLEGVVVKSWVSTKDNLLNHDTQDVNFNVRPDPPYRRLVARRIPGDDDTGPEFADQTLIGIEWERGSHPERARPSPGDRVSVFGFWIHDCGHPPFYTEIHPPVGVAVHRPRPVPIPSDRSFLFSFPDGDVTDTVGTNVFVPGIITDVWFNRSAGETTRNCSTSGLHQSGACFNCPVGGDPNRVCFSEGDCIRGPAPLDREFQFRIYLPRSPQAVTTNPNPPRAPLYMEIQTPFSLPFRGPDPAIVLDPTETFLEVTLDLRSFEGPFYFRRIVAAWVYASPDNWGLERKRVRLNAIDAHNDLDPFHTWPYDDGDWRFWMNLNNGTQEWIRILDGDCNVHGRVTFGSPWETGESDPLLLRGIGTVDLLHRLGPDVLVYPDQVVWVGAGGFEKDSALHDDPGRVGIRVAGSGEFKARSSKGHYTLEFEVDPGVSVGPAQLTSTAQRLFEDFSIRCFSAPFRFSIGELKVFPAEVGSCRVQGISRRSPWQAEGDAANSELGSSAASAGDVNGDGFSDFIVGAAGQNGDAGHARVHHGFDGEVSVTPAWTVDGDQAEGFLGRSVSSAGDVNDDGFDDIIVGADGYGPGGTAFAWLGSASGLPADASPQTAPWKVSSSEASAFFGFSVSSAGDVNGDDFDDVIVGAPIVENGDSRPRGRAFVYLGSASGLEDDPAAILVPDPLAGSSHFFGTSVSGAGDVNDDGYDDVVVGAPLYSRVLSNRGAFFLYLGSDDGAVSDQPARLVEGSRADALLGFSVASAGDVDDDGFSDVIVGAPTLMGDDGTADAGAAFVYTGSSLGLGAAPAWSAFGSIVAAEFGTSVDGAGDLDGDGFDDIVVGAPNRLVNDEFRGRVSVFLSGEDGPSQTPSWTTDGAIPEAVFGGVVAGAGDVDGDGFDDLLIGAPEWSDGEENEGSAFLQHGCGPTEVTPANTRFFRSVGQEQYVLFNYSEPGYGALVEESAQLDPERLEATLVELRSAADEALGTPQEPMMLIELELLSELFPPDLWDEYLGDLPPRTGGALFLDCGSANELTDVEGRRWKPDGAFLVSDGTEVEVFAGLAVDTSLLSDPSVPNEVFLSERRRESDIQYEIPVLPGEYDVVLYFSENCPDCVSPPLGGTGCAGCSRVFDVEIEDEFVEAYNPADAALPPAGDGLGTTFTATEVRLGGVEVLDGTLNLRLRDSEPGGAPDSPAIKAIAIIDSALVGGRQRPSDCNQDGQLDLSDGVCLLGNLFLGTPARLPCGDGTSDDPGNATLLDSNGDGGVDVSDVVSVFGFLFLGGPAPVLGTDCVPIAGCPASGVCP